MSTPRDYLGVQIKTALEKLPGITIRSDNDDQIIYCQRFEPRVLGGREHRQFHIAGAFAYELYILCSDNQIEDIHHRIAQTPCSHHSYAAHSAPAWLFPEGAMFDIDWEEIILPVQKRMLELLDAIVGVPKDPKKVLKKRTAKAVIR